MPNGTIPRERHRSFSRYVTGREFTPHHKYGTVLVRRKSGAQLRIPDQLLHCRYDVNPTLQVADATFVVCELSSKVTVVEVAQLISSQDPQTSHAH